MKSLGALLLVAGSACPVEPTVKLDPAPGSVFEVKGNQKKALMRFDLSAIPAGTTIVKARLALTLTAVVSEPPLNPKRFAVTVEEARAANLVVKGPGEYAVDLTKLVRGKSAVAVSISGMEANPGATISRTALEIEYSFTAPQADAGGAVFQLRPGAIRLDGGKSALPDGGKAGLRYSWTIARPAWGSP
ncbi:MAG: hypothetical protein Q8N47_09030, partial [Bryobacterales bacterium]|nr:hypothetical protein [Bryobacterales bacterium]